MAKVKAGMTLAELVVIKNGTDLAEAALAKAEIARQKREFDAEVGEDGDQVDASKHTVCYNASGQIYYRQSKNGASAITKDGKKVYQGGANLDLAIVLDLCEETPSAVALRAEMLALRNVPKAERDRLVAIAVQKKEDNKHKGILRLRKDVERLIVQGIATSDALYKFDCANQLVGLPGMTSHPAPEAAPEPAPETAVK